MPKPNAWQRTPIYGRQPTPNPDKGLVLRTIDARDREDRDQALARARAEKPWGTRIVGQLVRSGATQWSCLIRETDEEREVRLRALAERRAAR